MRKAIKLGNLGARVAIYIEGRYKRIKFTTHPFEPSWDSPHITDRPQPSNILSGEGIWSTDLPDLVPSIESDAAMEPAVAGFTSLGSQSSDASMDTATSTGSTGSAASLPQTGHGLLLEGGSPSMIDPLIAALWAEEGGTSPSPASVSGAGLHKVASGGIAKRRPKRSRRSRRAASAGSAGSWFD